MILEVGRGLIPNAALVQKPDVHAEESSDTIRSATHSL
jgi:hypothetical protein